MRWKLELQSSGKFKLNLMHGESRPYTLGFMDTTVRNYVGSYTIEEGHQNIYHLKGNGIKGDLMLDSNILYFLDKNGQPYTGNADFSFALNRK